MKVIKTTDGKFAIVERTQVNRHIAIWSPVDERRWDDEASAELAHLRMKMGIKEPPIVKEKPKVAINRSHLPYWEDLRIVKLEKGVFVVEQNKFGKWEEIKTFKTKPKAEEYIRKHSSK